MSDAICLEFSSLFYLFNHKHLKIYHRTNLTYIYIFQRQTRRAEGCHQQILIQQRNFVLSLLRHRLFQQQKQEQEEKEMPSEWSVM